MLLPFLFAMTWLILASGLFLLVLLLSLASFTAAAQGLACLLLLASLDLLIFLVPSASLPAILPAAVDVPAFLASLLLVASLLLLTSLPLLERLLALMSLLTTFMMFHLTTFLLLARSNITYRICQTSIFAVAKCRQFLQLLMAKTEVLHLTKSSVSWSESRWERRPDRGTFCWHARSTQFTEILGKITKTCQKTSWVLWIRTGIWY